MDNRPLISIIVPIYNVEKYIDRCISSLLSQTEKNIEIILVDDGSPDKCPLICDEYAEKDDRIIVLHKKNGGLSDARNAGIERATGKYIMFVDSDDYIDQKSCENLIPFISTNVDIIVYDGVTIGSDYSLKHFEESWPEVKTGMDFLKLVLKNGNMSMAAWLNIYRREFLNQYSLRFKCGILHEDEEFTPRVFLVAKTVVYSSIDVYRYIIRDNSITTKKDKRKNLNDLYETFVELKNLYSGIVDRCLKNQLLDTLSVKYMSKYYEADGFEYGFSYGHRLFVLMCAKLFRTKIKAVLFCLSPRLYCKINRMSKTLKKHK